MKKTKLGRLIHGNLCCCDWCLFQKDDAVIVGDVETIIQKWNDNHLSPRQAREQLTKVLKN